MPISEARRRRFELVEEVITGRADRVALSHKGHDERGVGGAGRAFMRADSWTKLVAAPMLIGGVLAAGDVWRILSSR